MLGRESCFDSWFQSLRLWPLVLRRGGDCGKRSCQSWHLGSSKQEEGRAQSSVYSSRAHPQWPNFLLRAPPPKGPQLPIEPPAFNIRHWRPQCEATACPLPPTPEPSCQSHPLHPQHRPLLAWCEFAQVITAVPSLNSSRP